MPYNPVPLITSFAATTQPATIDFDIPMDTSTGLTGAGWSWRKSNQMYGGSSATWLTSQRLQVAAPLPDADVGAQVYSYNAALGNIRSVEGAALASVTNHAY